MFARGQQEPAWSSLVPVVLPTLSTSLFFRERPPASRTVTLPHDQRCVHAESRSVTQVSGNLRVYNLNIKQGGIGDPLGRRRQMAGSSGAVETELMEPQPVGFGASEPEQQNVSCRT